MARHIQQERRNIAVHGQEGQLRRQEVIEGRAADGGWLRAQPGEEACAQEGESAREILVLAAEDAVVAHDGSELLVALGGGRELLAEARDVHLGGAELAGEGIDALLLLGGEGPGGLAEGVVLFPQAHQVGPLLGGVAARGVDLAHG